MNTLTQLSHFAISLDGLQTLVSIALAAAVFFYFVYLLRKEEDHMQEERDKMASHAQGNLQQQT